MIPAKSGNLVGRWLLVISSNALSSERLRNSSTLPDNFSTNSSLIVLSMTYAGNLVSHKPRDLLAAGETVKQFPFTKRLLRPSH